eukprot:g4284.t1
MQRTSELRSGGLGRLETPSLQDSVTIPRQLSDRVSQLIQVIQPSRASEDRRHSIADYVRRLIVKCFQPDHKVEAFMFGSVPLRTYLPDGDIDVSIFCEAKGLQETWCDKLSTILENEAENPDAEFKVTNVSLINAEVKLLKCLVDNIVVDVSFNQIGGLCTLVFLEAMDRRIGSKHLFKRSIILIKAWCYYESRVLGAQHSLLSTYALETMVLYIFNVYHSELQTPLEVLYKFLIVFHHFEWDKFCLTLCGPVSLKSLDTSTVMPVAENGSLLFPTFLNVMQDAYSYTPVVPTNSKGPGYPKCINIMDPLLHSNNLGRSVSKTSEIRIRNAFGHGARLLHQLFPKDLTEAQEAIDCFFKNTWLAQRRPRLSLEPHVPRPQSSALSIEQQSNQEAHAGHYILELFKDQNNNRELAVPPEQENITSVAGLPTFHTPFPSANGTTNQQNNNFNGGGGGIFAPHGASGTDRMLAQHPVHGVRNAAELEKLMRPLHQPIRALFENQVNKGANGSHTGSAFAGSLDPYQFMHQYHHQQQQQHQQQQLFSSYPAMKGFPHQSIVPMQGLPSGRQSHLRDMRPMLIRTQSAPNIGECTSKKKDKNARNLYLAPCFPQYPKKLPMTAAKIIKEDLIPPLKQGIPLLPVPQASAPLEKETRKPAVELNRTEDLNAFRDKIRLSPDLIAKLNAMETKRIAESEKEEKTEDSKKPPVEESDDKSVDSHPPPLPISNPLEPANPPIEKTGSNEENASKSSSNEGGAGVSEMSSIPVNDQSIVIGEPPEPTMVTLEDFPNRIDREIFNGVRNSQRRVTRMPGEFQQQIPPHLSELRTPLIRPGMGIRPTTHAERQLQSMIEMTPGSADFHQSTSFAPVYPYMIGHPPHHHYPQAHPNHLYGVIGATGQPQGTDLGAIQQINGGTRPAPPPGNQSVAGRPPLSHKPGEQGSLADLFAANYQQVQCYRTESDRRLNGGNTNWNFPNNYSPLPATNSAIPQQRGTTRDENNPRETDDVLSGDIETLTQHLEVARNFVGKKPGTERTNDPRPSARETSVKKPSPTRQDTSKSSGPVGRDRPPSNPLRTPAAPAAGTDSGNPPFTPPNHHLPLPHPAQTGSNVMYPVQTPTYGPHSTLEGVPVNEVDLLAQLHANMNMNCVAGPPGYILQGPHARGMHMSPGPVPLHLAGHPQSVVTGNLPLPPPPQQRMQSSALRPNRESTGLRTGTKETGASRRISEDDQQPMCVEIDGGKRVEIDASIIQAVEAALAGKGTGQEDGPRAHQPLIRDNKSFLSPEDSSPYSPRLQVKDNGQLRGNANGHEIPALATTGCQLEEGVVSYKLPKGTSTGFVSHRLPFPSTNLEQGGFHQSAASFSNHLVQLLQQQQQPPPIPVSEPSQNKISPMSYGTGSFIPMNSEFANDQRKAKEERDTQMGEEGSWNSGSGSDKTEQHNDQRSHPYGRYTPSNGSSQQQRSSTSVSNRSSSFGHTLPRGGYQRPSNNNNNNSMTDTLQLKQERQNLTRGLNNTKDATGGADLSDYYKDYGKVANSFVSTDIMPRLPGHGNNFVSFPVSNAQQQQQQQQQQQGQGYPNLPNVNHSSVRGNIGSMHNNVGGYNQHLSFSRNRREHDRDGRWSTMSRNVRDRSATPDGLSNRNNNRRNFDSYDKWEGKRFIQDRNLYQTHNSLDPLLERFGDGATQSTGRDDNKDTGGGGGVINANNNPQSIAHTNIEQLFRQNLAGDGLPPAHQRFRRPDDSRSGGNFSLKDEDFPRLESTRTGGKPPNAPQSRCQTPNALDRHNQ